MGMLLTMILGLAAGLPGAVLEGFNYKDAAAAAVWRPLGESGPVKPAALSGTGAALDFPCGFGSGNDWRVLWDRPLPADMSAGDQVLLRLRSPDPGAVSQGILYFRAGGGWYRLPPF